MEAELSALAATAAATLVGLLTTDAWERVKDGLGALWRQVHPERAQTIEADITEARGELLAPGSVAADYAAGRLVTEWESRIYRLLLSNPKLVTPLQQLLNETSVPRDPERGLHVENFQTHVKTSGHSRAYVIGKGTQWNGRRDG